MLPPSLSRCLLTWLANPVFDCEQCSTFTWLSRQNLTYHVSFSDPLSTWLFLDQRTNRQFVTAGLLQYRAALSDGSDLLAEVSTAFLYVHRQEHESSVYVHVVCVSFLFELSFRLQNGVVSDAVRRRWAAQFHTFTPVFAANSPEAATDMDIADDHVTASNGAVPHYRTPRLLNTFAHTSAFSLVAAKGPVGFVPTAEVTDNETASADTPQWQKRKRPRPAADVVGDLWCSFLVSKCSSDVSRLFVLSRVAQTAPFALTASVDCSAVYLGVAKRNFISNKLLPPEPVAVKGGAKANADHAQAQARAAKRPKASDPRDSDDEDAVPAMPGADDDEVVDTVDDDIIPDSPSGKGTVVDVESALSGIVLCGVNVRP